MINADNKLSFTRSGLGSLIVFCVSLMSFRFSRLPPNQLYWRWNDCAVRTLSALHLNIKYFIFHNVNCILSTLVDGFQPDGRSQITFESASNYPFWQQRKTLTLCPPLFFTSNLTCNWNCRLQVEHRNVNREREREDEEKKKLFLTFRTSCRLQPLKVNWFYFATNASFIVF